MSEEAVVLAGRLDKFCRFPCLKRWQTRVFLVTDKKLEYRRENRHEGKQFLLEGIIDVQFKDAIVNPFEFRIVLESKTLRLRARSLSQRNNWIVCLRPKRRYSETHRVATTPQALELSDFVMAESHKGRLLGSILEQLVRRRLAHAWDKHQR